VIGDSSRDAIPPGRLTFAEMERRLVRVLEKLAYGFFARRVLGRSCTMRLASGDF
jgi:hypothetical protein